MTDTHNEIASEDSKILIVLLATILPLIALVIKVFSLVLGMFLKNINTLENKI